MSVSTILAAVSGGSASNGAIEFACRYASRLQAHVEGYHVVVDPIAVFAAAGEGFGFESSLIDSIAAESAETAVKAKRSFDAIAASHHLPYRTAAPPARDQGASADWREETGYAPKLVAERARFFDLVVLGRSERVIHETSTGTIEQTLTRSGRPVLLAPAEPPASTGSTVAVAWNGSPQAVRALSSALPILANADAVSIITVGDAAQGGSSCLLEYLAWHRITARHLNTPRASGQHIGQALLSTARDANADLLVMGGYGHQPWREAIFGGATREILGTSLIPVLLVH
ncbi:MAG: universal stress protein [Bryobacteraceae bacterium]